MKVLAERIKMLRKEKGLSQTELGELVGIAKQSVSNYESGMRIPSYIVLKKLAIYFNVTSDYLVGLSDIRGNMDVRQKVEEFYRLRKVALIKMRELSAAWDEVIKFGEELKHEK